MHRQPHTEEAKRKIGDALMGNKWNLGHIVSEETRKKISNTLRGQIFTEERCRNISHALRERKFTDEHKKKIGAAHVGMKRSPEARRKMSEVAMGKVRSEGTRKKMSMAKIESFKNSDYCRMMGCAWGLKPNKPETFLIELLDGLYPGEWKYTGDFSFIINGKNPDFVNCNGQKKIIELFGDYWHEGENPQDRADKFSPFGYQTLVIWERELKNIGEVVKKIQVFHEAA